MVPHFYKKGGVRTPKGGGREKRKKEKEKKEKAKGEKRTWL